MQEVLNIIFWALLSFMVADYALGRATVKDPLRAVIAAVFAVLFVLVSKDLF
jgi:hypothetical protein